MKVLLLCTTHNDLYLVKALKKLGAYIIATGKVQGLPGERFVDKYIMADYSDKELILKIAKEEKIDRIVQCCNDYGVYTACYVAEKLNLPGYDSYETICTLHDKDRFKAFCIENGIPAIPSYPFSDAKEAKKWIESASFPLIIKPVDCSAGNGIRRVDSVEEAYSAIDNAFEMTRAGRILIERFIEGSQHGFSTFIVGGKVVAKCSNDEYSFENPYRVEIDTFPASDNHKHDTCLIEAIEKIARFLNLKDGMFHLQYRVENGKPYIIEVMRRIAGNMYEYPASLLTGFEWDYWETRARCGLSLDKIPKETTMEGFFAYKTILAQKEGIIKSINVPHKYDKYLWDSYYLMKPGDEITKHLNQPIGFLFLMFSSMEEMLKVLVEEYLNDMVEME